LGLAGGMGGQKVDIVPADQFDAGGFLCPL
jgi:hypothetical protein